MASPTLEEMELLQKFRENIQDLIPSLTELQKTDILLLGWIRARENSLPKAEAMIRKAVQWRKDNDFENAISWDPPSELTENLPWNITGYNCTTRKNPVLVVPFGKWDLRKYVDKEGGPETFIRYTQHIFGHIIQHLVSQSSFQEGNIVSQFVVILDFEDYSFRQLASSKCVRSILDLITNFEDNCPEMLHSAYIINAPKIFSVLFSLVKPLLTMRTLGKIQIYGSNPNLWKPVLLKHISADTIPRKYGGTGDNIQYAQTFVNGGNTGPGPDNSSITVGAGKVGMVSMFVPVVPATLKWSYKVKGHDIGFRIEFGNKPVLVYSQERETEGNGEINCEHSGTYSLVFDNTYSRLRSKTVYYTWTSDLLKEDELGQQIIQADENLQLIQLSDSE